MNLFRLSVCSAALFIALPAVQAQSTTPQVVDRATYKCKIGGKIVYQHTQCDGEVINAKPKRTTTSRNVAPPQDRALAARRAELSPEQRKECEALDVTIPQLEDGVKAQGNNVKPEDERALTEAKKKFREGRCR